MISRLASGLLAICLTTNLEARIPAFGAGQADMAKIKYCTRLVNKYGHSSQEINSRYYGIGVKRPTQGGWSLRLKEPGWFQSDLFIIFEQTTEEKYEDFTHTAYCRWYKDGHFEFVVNHFMGGGAILCYKYAQEPEHMCP